MSMEYFDLMDSLNSGSLDFADEYDDIRDDIGGMQHEIDLLDKRHRSVDSEDIDRLAELKERVTDLLRTEDDEDVDDDDLDLDDLFRRAVDYVDEDGYAIPQWKRQEAADLLKEAQHAVYAEQKAAEKQAAIDARAADPRPEPAIIATERWAKFQPVWDRYQSMLAARPGIEAMNRRRIDRVNGKDRSYIPSTREFARMMDHRRWLRARGMVAVYVDNMKPLYEPKLPVAGDPEQSVTGMTLRSATSWMDPEFISKATLRDSVEFDDGTPSWWLAEDDEDGDADYWRVTENEDGTISISDEHVAELERSAMQEHHGASPWYDRHGDIIATVCRRMDGTRYYIHHNNERLEMDEFIHNMDREPRYSPEPTQEEVLGHPPSALVSKPHPTAQLCGAETKSGKPCRNKRNCRVHRKEEPAAEPEPKPEGNAGPFSQRQPEPESWAPQEPEPEHFYRIERDNYAPRAPEGTSLRWRQTMNGGGYIAMRKGEDGVWLRMYVQPRNGIWIAAAFWPDGSGLVKPPGFVNGMSPEDAYDGLDAYLPPQAQLPSMPDASEYMAEREAPQYRRPPVRRRVTIEQRR